jgi:hypothetical protein
VEFSLKSNFRGDEGFQIIKHPRNLGNLRNTFPHFPQIPRRVNCPKNLITVQLEVLKMMRIDAVEKTHERLQELFVRHENAPIRMRDPEKSHGLHRDLMQSCVKTYPKIYGIEVVKSARGGNPSMVIFLRKHKPSNFGA